jgi:natural product biosynthesis luciferase-like monooxygenase protein
MPVKPDELSKRLGALTPEQRRLLEERLRTEGIDAGPGRGPAAPPSEPPAPADLEHAPMRFSFFFFSADGAAKGGDRYDLVLDCARYADAHGFEAVWTPERHFVEFGGLYPNPSVLGAALALVTERVQIRAGSVVLPLHHPVRVAEEWSVVDNLSKGRAAISCASGWHPDVFVLAPHRYADRKQEMVRSIREIRRLWAGETVAYPGVDGAEVPVRVLPRPVQPTLPLWITTSGSLETWELAGELETNVLATLGNQSVDELAEKIRRYRAARTRHGEDPQAGTVSLMLHTHVGPDLEEVRSRVRAPLAEYLRTHMAQRDRYVAMDRITDHDKRALADLATEHYLERASLLGTPAFCSRLVNRLASAGVDEIACLLDFGLDPEDVRLGLEHLSALRAAHSQSEVLA